MNHFAELFVFNGLTRFSFRMESQAQSRPHETVSRPCGSVLKNSNRRPPARQEKVDRLAGRPVRFALINIPRSLFSQATAEIAKRNRLRWRFILRSQMSLARPLAYELELIVR